MNSHSKKSVVVIGASPNSERYSYKATVALSQRGHKVFPIGIRSGNITQHAIITERPHLADIHTISLYVGPEKLSDWKNYILSLKPHRIIFNPGTYDAAIDKEFSDAGIETLEACTLVMLSLNQF